MPRACALSSGSLKKQMSRKKTEPEAAAMMSREVV